MPKGKRKNKINLFRGIIINNILENKSNESKNHSHKKLLKENRKKNYLFLINNYQKLIEKIINKIYALLTKLHPISYNSNMWQIAESEGIHGI